MIREEYKLGHKLQIIQRCEFKPNKMDHRFKSWI